VGQRQLAPYAVNRTIKALAQRAGVDPETTKRLSGHSMRVGAALDMVENGIDLVPIMHAGGWKSSGMVLRYSQQIDLAKSGTARPHAKERVKAGP
jgi:site-specific recombinase XerD